MKSFKFSRLLLAVGLWLFAVCTEAAREVAAPQNIFARKTVSLNGRWHYFADPQEQGLNKYGYFRNAKPQRPSDLIEYDFDASPAMDIPGDWNTQDERLFLYEGTVWFCRTFSFTPTAGCRTLLYFGAVNYEARVYVNGKEAGRHIGGFTPFCFDVTDELREGENFVIVKVDNKRHRDNVPTVIFDWWNYGGITRDVLLVSVPDIYVEDYTLQIKKDRLNGKKSKYREVYFSARLNNKEAGRQVTLSIPELKIQKTFTTDANGEVPGFTIQVSSSKLKLWSPESPKLYDIIIEHAGERIADEVAFRTIETRGKQILLNGEPIFLRGVCMHDESAYTNHRLRIEAESDTLISWAKTLGCNFLRLAHYPHNERTVREAERQGMLLWSEIPVYWTISWENEATYQNAERQLTDMIRRDHNRAAIIIWSIANETPHGDARDRFLSRLATHARSLDDTRLISMAMEVLSASNYVNRLQDNMNKYVDVVSFNQYIGWYRDVHDAPHMRWEIPYDKPVIISEFGGGAKAGLHGDEDQRWTEEFQERLYRENLAMLEKIDGLAGTCPWVLKDFRSQRRLLPGIQDLFNRKGLYSDQGQRKKASYVLQEWYKKR